MIWIKRFGYPFSKLQTEIRNKLNNEDSIAKRSCSKKLKNSFLVDEGRVLQSRFILGTTFDYLHKDIQTEHHGPCLHINL